MIKQNEPYLNAPKILPNPGPEYAPSKRTFQGISSLACGRDGRLWAVWYGGITPGEDENNYVMLAVSTDQGKTWSGEKLVVEHDDEKVRCFDPEIWLSPAGEIWVFWAQHSADNREADSLSGVWTVRAREADGLEAVWSAPERLCDGVMMCKPLILSSGEWALPVSYWHRREQGSATIIVSTDCGRTWSERGSVSVAPGYRIFDEHMLVELKDGRLWMLVRTSYGIGQSFSTNSGRSWTLLEPAAIPHACSRFFIRRLASGNLLLVRNAPSNQAYAEPGFWGQRSHLVAFLSEDEGRTWPYQLLLDEREQVSYPDGDQAEDGTLYITYDFDRLGQREVLFAGFSEEAIRLGVQDSPDVQLRGRISGSK